MKVILSSLFILLFSVQGNCQWKDLIGIARNEVKVQLFKREIQVIQTEYTTDDFGNEIILGEDQKGQYTLIFKKNVVVGVFWTTSDLETCNEAKENCSKNYEKSGRYLNPKNEGDGLNILVLPTKDHLCKFFLFEKQHRVSDITERLLGHWIVLENPDAFGDDFIEEWNERMTLPKGNEKDIIYPADDNSIFFTCAIDQNQDTKTCNSKGIISWITQYLEIAERSSEPRIFLSFDVSPNGEIENVFIRKGIDPETDAAAINVINQLPMFVPPLKQGKRVTLRYTVPITINIK
ncbi:MAG: energy transducer TonB [Flavobacteriales bacterium]|nr:energy transducer TonB [Flavobacteriales bacterium]